MQPTKGLFGGPVPRFARTCLNDSGAFALFEKKFKEAHGVLSLGLPDWKGAWATELSVDVGWHCRQPKHCKEKNSVLMSKASNVRVLHVSKFATPPYPAAQPGEATRAFSGRHCLCGKSSYCCCYWFCCCCCGFFIAFVCQSQATMPLAFLVRMLGPTWSKQKQ